MKKKTNAVMITFAAILLANSICLDAVAATNTAKGSTDLRTIDVTPFASTKQAAAGSKKVSTNVKTIAKATSTQATCETDCEAAVLDISSDVNPYDVYYDYGEDYQAYVDACDWSLVFDADYYAETFPMLAMQYHDDADLLLLHFQTVGVHEGRQGCESFNVGAYMSNFKNSIAKKAFGDENYAAYYIYYMLKYDTQKKIDAVRMKDKSEPKKQYTAVLTWYQKKELTEINKYRAKVNADPVKFDSELAAIAMFRGYVNVHEGYRDHDYLKDMSNSELDKFFKPVTAKNKGYKFAENTVTWYKPNASSNKICAGSYAKSKEHYNAMVNTKYLYVGVSNEVMESENDRNSHSQFDLYFGDTLDTPLHPYSK